MSDLPAAIRTPREEDRESIARVLSTSINFPLERALTRAPLLPLADIRVADVAGEIVATAGEFRLRQWFGGASLACSGIWGVATEPEHRRKGLATACTGALLDEARDRGDPVSALFPAVVEPYRRMGFELAGTHDVHRVALADLPQPSPQADALPTVTLADPDRDLAGIRALYARWAAPHTGPVAFERDEDWRRRVLSAPGDETFRSVVARDGDRVVGLLSFSRVAAEGHLDVAFGLDCRALVVETGAAQDALIAYVGGYAGLGRWIRFAGPPNDALSLRLPAQSLEVHERYRWMLRLLDVAGAFGSRGYPPIDAEATFAVEDPRYPENAGPWRVIVRDGVATVERLAEPHHRRPIPIGALSSMFAGYLRPHDAVLLGILDEDDPVIAAFATILAGPDPWNPFFF